MTEAILRHNRSTLKKLRIGDMVKFDRGWYSHWGVYVGEEAIIHLVGEDNDGINGQVNSGHLFTIHCCRSVHYGLVLKGLNERFWSWTLDNNTLGVTHVHINDVCTYILTGEEAIIHLVGEDNDGINGQVNSGHLFTICGKNFNKANVKLDSFWNVAGETKAYKNNDKDRKCSPKDAEKTVDTAIKMLGTIGYNVLWNNCEHFAAFCRYGVNWSEQANTVLKCVIGICAGIILRF